LLRGCCSAGKDSGLLNADTVRVHLSSDGTVTWVPQARFRSFCRLQDVHNIDTTHTCTLKLGSWTHDALLMPVEQLGVGMELDIAVGNARWEIRNTTATHSRTYYECCPEPYDAVVYTIEFAALPRPSNQGTSSAVLSMAVFAACTFWTGNQWT
jgi:hypothetical protein